MPEEPQKSTSEPTVPPAVPEEMEPATPGNTGATPPPAAGATGQDTPVANAEPAPQLAVIAPAKSGKKKWIVGGIVTAVLALMVGGSVAAYNLWYQNPDKVLADAFVNLLKAKSGVSSATLELSSKSGAIFEKLKLTVDVKTDTQQGEFNAKLDATVGGKNVSMSGAALYDKDDNLFFKINDLRKTLDSSGVPADSLSSMSTIISKIDGKWVKVSAEDMAETDPKFKERQTCLRQTGERLLSDSAAIDELAKLYAANKFVVVKEKLGSQNGSLGYRVEGDSQKAKSFAKGLNGTKALQEYQKCDKEMFTIDETALDGALPTETTTDNTRVEVWVNRWSHELSNVKVTGGGDTRGALTMNMQYNVPITVNAPTDNVVTMSELKKDIEAIVSQQTNDMQPRTQRSSNLLSAQMVLKATEAYNVVEARYPTYAQLAATTVPEAKLDPQLVAKLSQAAPSAANPDRIQYRLTSPTAGGTVSYYDPTTKKVQSLTFGAQASAT